jgi:hypothetical protein
MNFFIRTARSRRLSGFLNASEEKEDPVDESKSVVRLIAIRNQMLEQAADLEAQGLMRWRI